MRRVLGVLAAAFAVSAAAAGGDYPNDTAPIRVQDKISLQRGVHHFVNYCLNCHNAAFMRYVRLTDLDLTEKQIAANLILGNAKIGDTMTIAMTAQDAAKWFGGTPPDLSVIARSRGADWLYTYLRTYYRDPSTPTGWNNLRFPNVGMPHVLVHLQGTQELTKDAQGHQTLKLTSPGQLTPKEYDLFVADLVNYLVFMGEPARADRVQVGIVVLFFLAVLFVVVLLTKKEYWKDIK